MSRTLLPLSGFNSVAKGQPATCNLGTGASYTYDSMSVRLLKNGELVTLANLGTDVDEIRLEADGDPIRRVTPALLLDYLQSKSMTKMLTDGAGTAVASFVLPFSDRSRADVVGQELTALGTLGVKNLQLVVVLKDPGDAPVYSLDGTAIALNNAPKFLTMYERWAIDSFDVVNGTKELNTLAGLEDDLFGYIIHSNAITKAAVSIEEGGRKNEVFKATKAELAGVMHTHDLGESLANYFPVAADFTGQFTDRWITAVRDEKDPKRVLGRITNLTVEITATAAATVKVLRRSFRYWAADPQLHPVNGAACATVRRRPTCYHG